MIRLSSPQKVCRIAGIEIGDARAGPCEGQRHRAALSVSGAGDERDLARELARRRRRLCHHTAPSAGATLPFRYGSR